MRKAFILFVGLFFCFFNGFSQKTDQQLIDSVVHTQQPDTSKIEVLLNKGFQKALSADSSALLYSHKIFEIIGESSSPQLVVLKSSTFNVEGIYYQFVGKLDRAEASYQKSLKLGLAHNNFLIVAKANGNLGGLENNRGNYQKAASYLIKAIKTLNSIKEYALEANYLGDLGNTYIRLNQNKRAISVLLKSLERAEKEEDKRLQANLFNSLSTAYGGLRDFKKELDYLFKALSIYQETNNEKGLTTVYANIAELYQYRKNYPKALFYLKQSVAHAEIIDDKQNLAYVNKTLADIYHQTNRDDLAIVNANKAYEYAKLSEDKLIMQYALALKSDILSKNGDFKNAFTFLKESQKLSDTLFNKQMTDKVAELEVKYDLEKKEQEKHELRLSTELSETKRKNTIYGFLIFITALIVVGFLLLRNRNIKGKLKENLILNQALFDGEQKERIRIARDLHDSIGQMLAVLKMSLSQKPNEEKNLEILDKTIAELRHISHNLIPEALNFGLVNALEDLAYRINNAGKTTVNTVIDREVKEHQFDEQNALSIYRIVQEALGNITKHAEASAINLLLEKAEHCFNIEISDNGKGFDTSEIKQSKGLGWKNINARLTLMGGSMNVVSEKGKGSKLDITIPF